MTEKLSSCFSMIDVMPAELPEAYSNVRNTVQVEK